MKSKVDVSMYQHRVTDVADINRAVNSIRKKKGTWYTNFYLSREECNEYISNGTLSLAIFKSSILILKEEARFYTLYFATSDVYDFRVTLQQFSKNIHSDCVVHVLYMECIPNDIINALHSIGFKKRVRYERMLLKKQYSILDSFPSNLIFAQLCDVDEIYDILYTNFDEYSDCLPTKYEIGKGIKSQQDDIVLLKGDTGRIINIFWFKRQGKSVLWKYWVIRPEYRDKGLGKKLVKYILSRYSDAVRVILWVRDNNPRAKALHEHLGFALDGLNDHVMCLFCEE